MELVWRARRSSLPEQEYQRLGACLLFVVGAEAESSLWRTELGSSENPSKDGPGRGQEAGRAQYGERVVRSQRTGQQQSQVSSQYTGPMALCLPQCYPLQPARKKVECRFVETWPSRECSPAQPDVPAQLRLRPLTSPLQQIDPGMPRCPF